MSLKVLKRLFIIYMYIQYCQVTVTFRVPESLSKCIYSCTCTALSCTLLVVHYIEPSTCKNSPYNIIIVHSYTANKVYKLKNMSEINISNILFCSWSCISILLDFTLELKLYFQHSRFYSWVGVVFPTFQILLWSCISKNPDFTRELELYFQHSRDVNPYKPLHAPVVPSINTKYLY